METATFASGCFWCNEAIFKKLRGVESVTSGYSGGSIESPSYEQVSSGETGHVEAVEVKFDPQVISYKSLLEVFFALHDPTSLDKQGADEGSEYRLEIFYHSEQQKKEAEEFIQKLDSSGKFENKIVTVVAEAREFYPAENYYRDYYQNHSSQPYCKLVIDPKITKLYKDFGNLIKEE